MISPYGVPEEEYTNKEQMYSIQNILVALPEKYRTIIYLREYEQFSYEEIGQAMHLTLTQVKTTLFRARQKIALLRERMEDGGLIMEWNAEKEKKVLRRSKFTLFAIITRILLAFILLAIIYKMILSFIVINTTDTTENEYYTKFAIEITYPNVTVEDQHDNTSITWLGTLPYTNHLTKSIGNEQKYIGTVDISKTLWTRWSTIDMHRIDQTTNHSYHFAKPSDDATIYKEVDTTTWNRLAKLPEATVAELTFSLKNNISFQDFMTLMNKYDVNVLWVPLFMNKNDSTDHYFGINGSYSMQVEHGATSQSFYNLSSLSAKETEKLFLKNIKDLLRKGPNYYEKWLGLHDLPNKYKFIQKEGLQVYGAVITGPSQELLRLQQENQLYNIQIGEIAFWNWD